MKVYITTDTHFGHEMLVNNGHRPDGFEALILDGLSKVQGDLLIHLGDICIGQDEYWHDVLMKTLGDRFKKKLLIRGNHDGKSYNWYINHGWDSVVEYAQMRLFGRELLFSHMPVLPEDINTTLYYHPEMNIHGHLHGGGNYSHRAVEGYKAGYHYDCAPDTHRYLPVNLEKIL